MKNCDYGGRELKVGDFVAVSVSAGWSGETKLVTCKIVGFDDGKIKVDSDSLLVERERVVKL